MSVAKQALGFVEEKLRRVFNLAGPIGLTLNPVVTPVVQVDDLRDPGHAFFQGRSFVYTAVDTGLAGSVARTIKFNADVTLEGFWVETGQLAVGSFVQVYLVTPDEMVANPPTALISILYGAWRDRKEKSFDQPPILANGTFSAVTGTVATANNVMWQACAGATPMGIRQQKIFIPAGGGLVFLVVNVANVGTGLIGRVFPQ